MKKQLPNSVAVLVLGILSITTGYCVLGLILGIIAISLAGKPKKLYFEDPKSWTGYKMIQAGWICGIIGIVLSGLSFARYFGGASHCFFGRCDIL